VGSIEQASGIWPQASGGKERFLFLFFGLRPIA
jgi:hypothetical protein